MVEEVNLGPLAAVTGQRQATAFLASYLGGDTFPPLLFAGPAGVGKRTAALLLAQAANCREAAPGSRAAPCGTCRECRAISRLEHPDVRLLLPVRLPKTDPAPQEVMETIIGRYPDFTPGRAQPFPDPKLRIPIHAVRWLRTEMGKPPLQARRRFFIILGAHQMQKEAANALLKMLEEPQARTTFVLTTDSPGFLLDTIRSRCQTVRFGAIPEPAMRAWLRENAGAPEPELDLAVLLSAGSLGGALRFLEDKASFLSAPVVDYFAGRAGSGEKAVLDTLDAVKDAAPVAVVGTYIFLYREALKSRLGITSPFAGVNPGVFRGTENADPAHLRRALKYLLNRAPEAGLSIAPRLFNYTLLSVLRPPGSR